MKTNTIAKLCCPFDKHDLQLRIFSQTLEQNVLEGILSCATCQREYQIVYGVPIMVPDEYRQASLEASIAERWKFDYKVNDIKLIT